MSSNRFLLPRMQEFELSLYLKNFSDLDIDITNVKPKDYTASIAFTAIVTPLNESYMDVEITVNVEIEYEERYEGRTFIEVISLEVERNDNISDDLVDLLKADLKEEHSIQIFQEDIR